MIFNQLMLLGRVNKQPELRVTGGGRSVCTVWIVQTWRVKKPTPGAGGNAFEWGRQIVPVSCFGSMAEWVARAFRPKMVVMMSGLVRVSFRPMADGTRRMRFDLEARHFQIVSLPKKGGGSGGRGPGEAGVEDSGPPRLAPHGRVQGVVVGAMEAVGDAQGPLAASEAESAGAAGGASGELESPFSGEVLGDGGEAEGTSVGEEEGGDDE